LNRALVIRRAALAIACNLPALVFTGKVAGAQIIQLEKIMPKSPVLKERLAKGNAIRKLVARSTHEAVGDIKRDPVQLLESSSKGRVERLISLRYGRMLASPFAFYRGSAIVQAHDLASTPHTGVIQQICGDCHLMNFGGFATPERNLVFDLNDFDETHPGPWEWDVKRLAASLTVCARHLGFKPSVADEVVVAAIESYQHHMAIFSEMSAMDLWYEKITIEKLFELSQDEDAKKIMADIQEKAQRRTHEMLLPKMAKQLDGRWVMNDAPPALFHIHSDSTLFAEDDDWMKLGHWEVLSKKLLDEYRRSLSPSHQQLLSYFTLQDLAFKVVGVGSVGTRCLALLMTDDQDNPLFLQIKEALPSVLAPYVPAGKSAFRHEGQRVVAGQRKMQSASDIFLGTSTGPLGRHFYFRQLRDMKISADIETFDANLLTRYASLCGRALARAHARAGGFAAEISGYLGSGEQFSEALVKYSNQYADQIEDDFEKFRSACRSGRLIAQTEEDFDADISV
jgi:uncharacterized protein (DUF2252 family)